MRRRVAIGMAALASSLVAMATRLYPLSWSPYPGTLDGFVHARVAREALARGRLRLPGLRADQIIEPMDLAIVSAVMGIEPVRLAQPMYGLVGSVTVLLGILFVVRLGRERGWHRDTLKLAAITVGFVLAVDGLFVRRTGVPDSDTFTLLLIPLVTLAVFLYARRGRRAWLVVTAVGLLVLPLTHTFSTLIAALGLTALLAVEVGRAGKRRRVGVVVGLVGLFWLYIYSYYQVAPLLSLSVPYVGRISAHPGLFLAWVVLLVLGVRMFPRLSGRTQRAGILLPIGLFFAIMVVNARVQVFPGTVQTPTIVLLLLLPLAIPALVAGLGAPSMGRRDSVGMVVLVLIAAPFAQILFSLTAALTPEFFATAMRAQTFAHVGWAALVAIAAVTLPSALTPWGVTPDRDRITRGLVVGIVVVAVLWTLPIAYIALDTGGYPKGAFSSEFQAATFVHEHVEGPWTSDHKQTSIAGNYYGTNGRVGPTASWLSGGNPPDCTLLSKRSWTTNGAHLFPTAPLTISSDRYERTVAVRNRIYSTGGLDPITITRPRVQTTGGC